MHEINLILFPEDFEVLMSLLSVYIRRDALALGYTEYLYLMRMVTGENWSVKMFPVTYFVPSCYQTTHVIIIFIKINKDFQILNLTLETFVYHYFWNKFCSFLTTCLAFQERGILYIPDWP